MTTLTETIENIIGKPMNTIKRESAVFRPLFALGQEIKRIHLHDGEKILCTKHQGWLEHIEDTEKFNYSGVDVISINALVRNARTVNLSKRDNFIVSYNDKEKSYWESGKALYLYVTDYHLLKTVRRENELSTEEIDYHTFTLSAIIQTAHLKENYEELPHGSRLEYRATPIDKLVIFTDWRTTPTQAGKDLNQLTEDLNKSLGRTHELSTYQVEKLLKDFTITRKN